MMKAQWAMEYEETVRNKEIYWRQRSRIQRIKEGDKNTKYFHRMATVRKRINTIDSLMIDGVLSSDSMEIKRYIVDFYFYK